MSRKPSKRWLRFSIRSLIVWLLFSGIAFSAFHYRLRDAERQSATVARLRGFGGCVRYENHHAVVSAPPEANFVTAWLTKQLGLDFFHDVETICISGRGEISDDDFGSICQLRNIRSVRLGKTVVTDDGLHSISRLGELRSFRISSPYITDQGMDHLCQLHQLEWLTLVDIDLTDAGLAKLASLRNLEYLGVKQSKVSQQGVARLRSALPDCKIEYYSARY
jgi:hypothetical protein